MSVPMIKDPVTGEESPMPEHLLQQVTVGKALGGVPKPPEDASNVTNIADAVNKPKLSRAQLLEAIKPKFEPIYVAAFGQSVLNSSMTAAESDKYQAMQNTTVRLKRDGTAEYDAKMNQLRTEIVCEHTFWMDGTKVFDQPTDPVSLAYGDNAIVSLLFGHIDEMSSTSTDQLTEAKNASTKTQNMH